MSSSYSCLTAQRWCTRDLQTHSTATPSSPFEFQRGYFHRGWLSQRKNSHHLCENKRQIQDPLSNVGITRRKSRILPISDKGFHTPRLRQRISLTIYYSHVSVWAALAHSFQDYQTIIPSIMWEFVGIRVTTSFSWATESRSETQNWKTIAHSEPHHNDSFFAVITRKYHLNSERQNRDKEEGNLQIP